jgi:protein phosphatase
MMPSIHGQHRSGFGPRTPRRLAFAGLTNPGRIRAENEDALFADSRLGLFLVSDGMGGEFAGAVAAKIVAEVLPRMIRQHLQDWRGATTPTASETLKNILSQLSSEVRRHSEGQPGLHGMGATVVLVFIRGSLALIAHMGDSRLYLYRKGQLKRLTNDHTILQLLVECGDITEAATLTHRTSSQLTRYVGMVGEPLPEVRIILLKAGDLLLLCSDGLTRMVSDQEIRCLLGKGRSLPATVKCLMTAALDAGGRDNITALLISPVAGSLVTE